jgi:putative radical SAM enzyme (TIGR03279 family)
MTDADVDRIIKMRTSPMNISVHTTNPELRTKMLANPRAAKIMDILHRLNEANITLNCQIVLCRGVNDGAELLRTMHDLAMLYPNMQSVSVVPAGLTSHRNGLFPLTEFTPTECADVISQVDNFAVACVAEYGERIFFCADEFYIRAGLPLPNDEYYEGYPQLENGVGMSRLFAEEFTATIENIDTSDLVEPRKLSIATGTAAEKLISDLVDQLCNMCYNGDSAKFDCTVHKIDNDYLGHSVTVAGLVAGRDIIAQLSSKNLGKKLLIPRTMLRHDGDLFIDDVTLEQLESALGVPVIPVEVTGEDLVAALVES